MTSLPMKGSFWSVIGNQHFRNLWLGQITSQVALNMLNFALAIRVYELTRSSAAVSSMLLTFAIPSIVMGVIAGGIVEYFDKRYILIICNGFRALLFVAFFFFSDNLIALYALNVLMSLGTQLFIPAEGPAIFYVVPEKNLLRANALFSVTFFLSTMLGFVLAGPLVRAAGYQTAYSVMGALMLIATYFTIILPPLNQGKISGRFSFSKLGWVAQAVRQGVAFIWRTKRVRRSLVLLTVSQVLIATLAVLAPAFADRILVLDLTDASYIVMGPAAAGLIVGALSVGRFGTRYLKGTLIRAGIFGTVGALILLSLTSSVYLPPFFVTNALIFAVVLLFILGFFNSWISVPASTILQQDSEETMRGRVYGVLTSLTGGVSLLPVLLSGILADVIGVGKTMAVIGIVLLLGWSIHYTIHSR